MSPDASLGTVSEVWRYPVKSLQGERLGRVAVDARGVAGDRGWAVVTDAGKLGSGKDTRRFERVDGLFDLAAETVDGAVRVRTSGGVARAGSAEADALVAAALGRPATVRPETDVRHHDDSPLHILTTSSLAWLADRLGPEAAERRRFRPNLVMETGNDPELVEQGWVGATLVIGHLTVEVTHATERCRMVTLPQPGGVAEEPEVLRTLGRDNAALLGVYARVVRPGMVQVGAEVRRGGGHGAASG